MAIKISGNTVIDDSRNFCNLNTVTATSFVGDASGITGIDLVEVLKPENTSPTDGETDVSTVPTLCGSQFLGLYNRHCCSCFQVSECSDFSDCNVFTCEIAASCTSLTVPTDCLAQDTQYFFRLRYEDADGCCSEFSDATCFTVGVFPTTLRESIFGGFYMGTISAAGSCYYLIMAPNASGCACCQWRSVATLSDVGNERNDGYGNTYDHFTTSGFRAGNWTRTRNINGFTDWYLPAINELTQLYINGTPASGEGYKPTDYWSSTEHDTGKACSKHMTQGTNLNDKGKNGCRVLRAIRRIAFP